MAGSSVVGLGAGVILLLVLWAFTAVAWIQLSNKQSGLRIAITIVSTLITATLILIPTEDGVSLKKDGVLIDPDIIKPEDEFEVYDYMFIWKAVLIVLMLINVVVGFGVYATQFWSLKIHGPSPDQPKKAEEEVKSSQSVDKSNIDLRK